MNKRGYVALVGLPGCGKSTLARLLAKRIGCPSIDLDERVVEMAGATIPELFARGEGVFRDWETRALASIEPGRFVLSCGGGVVTRPENLKLLAQNGTVVYVDRPLEAIEGDVNVSNRPLLASDRASIRRLKFEREALYRSAADIVFPNDGAPQDAVEQLAEALCQIWF